MVKEQSKSAREARIKRLRKVDTKLSEHTDRQKQLLAYVALEFRLWVLGG